MHLRFADGLHAARSPVPRETEIHTTNSVNRYGFISVAIPILPVIMSANQAELGVGAPPSFRISMHTNAENRSCRSIFLIWESTGGGLANAIDLICRLWESGARSRYARPGYFAQLLFIPAIREHPSSPSATRNTGCTSRRRCSLKRRTRPVSVTGREITRAIAGQNFIPLSETGTSLPLSLFDRIRSEAT